MPLQRRWKSRAACQNWNSAYGGSKDVPTVEAMLTALHLYAAIGYCVTGARNDGRYYSAQDLIAYASRSSSRGARSRVAHQSRHR